MEWMKPWGEASEARSLGPWPGIAGLILCLGLGACGGKSGSEEATSNAAESAGPEATSEVAVPGPAAATSDLAPDAAFTDRPTVQAQPRGKVAEAQLVLTGSYKVDGKASANCALFPNKTFQVGINVPAAPFFVLRLENFHGAGEYDGDARVRANYSGESVRQSRGIAKTKITVTQAAPGGEDEISGTFSGTYKGEGGEGTLSGAFERCLYELPESNS